MWCSSKGLFSYETLIHKYVRYTVVIYYKREDMYRHYSESGEETELRSVVCSIEAIVSFMYGM